MKSRSPSLFLTELIINLCVFLLCAFVCAGLILRAYRIGRSSTDLTDAVALAQTAAETLRGGGASRGQYTERGFTISYVCADKDGVVTAEIRVSGGERTIYTLTAAWPEGGVG